MMKFSHDVYAEMNPAYCSVLLYFFVESYIKTVGRPIDLPLIYIGLPILLSNDYYPSFSGTNKTTGLREWLNRSPDYDVNLHMRLNGSLEVVSEALQFSCFSEYLILCENGKLILGRKKLKTSILKKIDWNLLESVKYSERLGSWFASAGSTKAVFDIMGLTV
ncbi:DUF6521 family protein [Acinetobacter nosocomialis]|nr:three component ABC system middle component [Acinetobacter nosocomialis]MDO7216985.1 DUF6521 family protein [Acinetobacter nosocomialis]